MFLATFWWRFLATAGGVVRNEDICGSHNGRRLYLELGERGVLYARNVTFVGDDARSPAYSAPPPPPYAVAANGSHRQCSLELVTCPSCVIVATFKSIALPHHCGDGGVVMDSSCRWAIWTGIGINFELSSHKKIEKIDSHAAQM